MGKQVEEDGDTVIKDSRLDRLESFTLCARFKTVQFLDLFDFIFGPCFLRAQNYCIRVLSIYLVSQAL